MSGATPTFVRFTVYIMRRECNSLIGKSAQKRETGSNPEKQFLYFVEIVRFTASYIEGSCYKNDKISFN